MKYTLLAFPFLAATAWGQAEDVYKTLAKGDRVQITFRSGGTITGMLVANPIGHMPKAAPKEGEPAVDDSIDYSKQNSLTVELSWEYPGLDGTMTLLKKEIKEVRKLQSLDKETMDRLRKQKAQIQQDLEKQNRSRVAESKKKDMEAAAAGAAYTQKTKSDQDAALSAADEAKNQKLAEEGLKLLKKFPPEAGWGPDKFKEISQKTQRKAAPITLDETEFIQNYPLWNRARESMDKAKSQEAVEKKN